MAFPEIPSLMLCQGPRSASAYLTILQEWRGQGKRDKVAHSRLALSCLRSASTNDPACLSTWLNTIALADQLLKTFWLQTTTTLSEWVARMWCYLQIWEWICLLYLCADFVSKCWRYCLPCFLHHADQGTSSYPCRTWWALCNLLSSNDKGLWVTVLDMNCSVLCDTALEARSKLPGLCSFNICTTSDASLQVLSHAWK